MARVRLRDVAEKDTDFTMSDAEALHKDPSRVSLCLNSPSESSSDVHKHAPAAQLAVVDQAVDDFLHPSLGYAPVHPFHTLTSTKLILQTHIHEVADSATQHGTSQLSLTGRNMKS